MTTITTRHRRNSTILGRLTSTFREATRPAATPRRARPGFEALEDRKVLSTISVTNNLDSGPGSLRDAIDRALPYDVVKLSPNLAGQTIQLTSGQLLVDTPLSIDATQAPDVRIDAGGRSNVIRIVSSTRDAGFSIAGASGHNLVIANGAATGPYASSGGNIVNIAGSGSGENLTLVNVTLTGGRGSTGGGLTNYQGHVTLAFCMVTGNTATQGGGIYSVGSRVVLNQTYVGSNSATGAQGLGGGVYLAGSGQLVLAGATLFANTAAVAGGGIYSVATAGSSVAITRNSYVTGNTAYFGGGVCIQGLKGVPVVFTTDATSSTRFNNRTLGGPLPDTFIFRV
ncbi:MAG: hypothetical protein U0835_01040 [Isosphaeraceae bacterium]